METAIWIIGLLAAVVIIVIYIITSVNKYSNKFVGKYFDEEMDSKINENKSVSDKTQVNIQNSDIDLKNDEISEKDINKNPEKGE